VQFKSELQTNLTLAMAARILGVIFVVFACALSGCSDIGTPNSPSQGTNESRATWDVEIEKAPQNAPDKGSNSQEKRTNNDRATLDMKRRAIIAQGKPVDQYADIVVTRNPNFDLNNTIYKSETSWVQRQDLEAGLNTQLYWNDRAIERINQAFVNVPQPVDVARELLTFMQNECHFTMEHADSSFLDHLLFGYEYSAAHYRQQSPRVMLLHSIMGGRTNLFPMKVEQIPRLQSLLYPLDPSGKEFMHIEAFPSVLRLLVNGKILPELLVIAGEQDVQLEKISFQRVMAPHIDLTMSAEDFWVQLNYQLMHLLDFLPASNWNDPMVIADPYLKLFTDLRQLLQQSGRLEAQVGFDAPVRGGPVGSFPKPTAGSRLRSAMSESMKWKLFTESVDDVSRELGHRLDYKLTWGHGSAIIGAGTPRHLEGAEAGTVGHTDMVFSASRFSTVFAVRGLEGATLDLRRREIIVEGKPIDHFKDIVLSRNPNFNLDTTIFKSVTNWLSRQYLEASLNTQLFWNDDAIERIQHAFVNVPAPPDVSRELLAFMHDECHFVMEHADASFLDHLLFSYEYSVAHYKQQSPRVMLLHSIMGGHTNSFPIEGHQIQKLMSLLDHSSKEFMHIRDFPSVLRLLVNGKMLPELLAAGKDVLRLEEVSFQRVMAPHIDVTMSAEDFWVQLNYQLMHLLDFLPASNWNDPMVIADPYFKLFTDLRQLLQQSGRLEAQVGFDAPVNGGHVGSLQELTVGTAIPESMKWKMFTESVEDFSRELGHSLDYKFKWARA